MRRIGQWGACARAPGGGFDGGPWGQGGWIRMQMRIQMQMQMWIWDVHAAPDGCSVAESEVGREEKKRCAAGGDWPVGSLFLTRGERVLGPQMGPPTPLVMHVISKVTRTSRGQHSSLDAARVRQRE